MQSVSFVNLETMKRYETKSSFRREARIVVLQSLCESDLVDHDLMAVLWRRIEESDIPDAYHEFAYDLVMEVFENCFEVDNMIVAHAPSWPLNQMAVVDRNVLRMAITEIKWRKDIPNGVAVNEAVELAKIFGSETSPGFVNGVLGSLIGSRN